MDRYQFNQELQGVVRHLLQCADSEADARSQHTAMQQIAAEPDGDVFISQEDAERAVEKTTQALAACGAKTDAAIMEFTDRLFDAIYLPRAEATLEAARLGASA